MPVDVEFMESVDALFSNVEDLGCGASYPEFLEWYDSISSEISVVNDGSEEIDTNNPLFILDLYDDYQSICDGIALDPIEEIGGEDVPVPLVDSDSDLKTEEATFSKFGMYITGGALLYLLLNSKKK